MTIMIAVFILWMLAEFLTSWTWKRWHYRHVYLRSKHWRRLRAQVAHRAGFTCERRSCTAYGQNLDVHHKTYERIGHERLEDLVYLCRADHKHVEQGYALMLKSGELLNGKRGRSGYERAHQRFTRR